MSTRRDPHLCRPVTTPDPSDSASTPVPVVPHPTPPNATKVELSSTASLPSAPRAHSSPSESFSYRISPRHVRDQPFPAIRPPEQSTPTPAKAGFRDGTPFTPRQSPVATLSRNLSEPYAHALAAAVVARTAWILRKGRASLSSRQSKRSIPLPEVP